MSVVWSESVTATRMFGGMISGLMAGVVGMRYPLPQSISKLRVPHYDTFASKMRRFRPNNHTFLAKTLYKGAKG